MSVDDTLHPFPHNRVLEKSDNQEEYEKLTRMLNLVQQTVEENRLTEILDNSWEDEYLFERSDKTVFLTIPRNSWECILTKIFNAHQDPLVHPDNWSVIKEIHLDFMEQNAEYQSNQWTRADEESIPANYEAFVVSEQ